MKRTILWSFISILLLSVLACNPDLAEPDPDARPVFSTDTITFDTVFTTIGSATLYFKVYNRGARPLLINSIVLAGGENSFFRLNIDGSPSCSENNVEVLPDDSLFIFVAVTIDPTNLNNPLIIKDSIVFITNGSEQDVKLIAYGQDVHLINDSILQTETWINDKPYLIYNSMAVDTGETLTIEEGAQLFFHRNSSLIVWGRVLVNGTPENPVVFQNDRLEEFYDVVAGQWGTIYIDPISTGNVINHAVIKNSIAGIQIGYPTAFQVPDLVLSNSFILNVSFAGIYAFGADITCYNTVIANITGPAAALLRGGRYRFLHTTISNNGVLGSYRSGPSLLLTNYFNNYEYNEVTGEYGYITYTGDLEESEFANSIIYGNTAQELQFADNGSNQFNYMFDHCLMKAIEDSLDIGNTEHYLSPILNKDPFFSNDSDRYHLNYSLDTLSPAKDAGSVTFLGTYPFLNIDLAGSLRDDGKPDLGAFERKEY